jgi:arsenate reductase
VPTDVGLQLLQSSTATVLALAASSSRSGPFGATLNPAVTLAERLTGKVDSRTAAAYIGAQVAGGCLGTVVANLMFELPAVEWRRGPDVARPRALAGGGTFGLLTVVFGVCGRDG